MTPASLPERVKSSIRRRVVGLFNDVERGQTPVMRSPDALFAPGSVVWRVHGDVGSMMVGGVASLLLQMLHPSVLAGVWDHSNFRKDMHGRLRRTARFIAMTTYGERTSAETAIATVRRVHDRVAGTLPDGTPYSANDPALLAWVHVTETSSFLDAWIRYGEPLMPTSEQDRYFAQMAQVGEMLGADPLPRSRAQAQQLTAQMRPQLKVDARTREIAELILAGRGAPAMGEVPRKLAMQAAIDLLPDWARRMHGFSLSPLERPLVRAGTFGVAQTLRWAFR
ncbi:oxygenase MpaB family protein [Novosphingobium sp. 9U]|uniref:oxygenase MpaB family protein n=1 Tax=Novosphingobium sp. 9U TaxID=2653158 RepID=UPI001358830F|nr:oxygenase MpaB family protein [Novosphingobium sp. 9U]